MFPLADRVNLVSESITLAVSGWRPSVSQRASADRRPVLTSPSLRRTSGVVSPRKAGKPGESSFAGLRQSLGDYVGANPPFDDVTLVVAKRV